MGVTAPSPKRRYLPINAASYASGLHIFMKTAVMTSYLASASGFKYRPDIVSKVI
jgi:hypothetical protein